MITFHLFHHSHWLCCHTLCACGLPFLFIEIIMYYNELAFWSLLAECFRPFFPRFFFFFTFQAGSNKTVSTMFSSGQPSRAKPSSRAISPWQKFLRLLGSTENETTPSNKLIKVMAVSVCLHPGSFWEEIDSASCFHKSPFAVVLKILG